jgi:hypothetical protein
LLLEVVGLYEGVGDDNRGLDSMGILRENGTEQARTGMEGPERKGV